MSERLSNIAQKVKPVNKFIKLQVIKSAISEFSVLNFTNFKNLMDL